MVTMGDRMPVDLQQLELKREVVIFVHMLSGLTGPSNESNERPDILRNMYVCNA